MDIQAGAITFVAHYTVGQSALTVANAFAATVNGNGGTSVIATVPTGTYSAQNSSGQTVCQNGVVPNTTESTGLCKSTFVLATSRIALVMHPVVARC